MRNSGDDHLTCILVVRLYPFRICLTCVVPNKGVHDFAVKRLAQFMGDTGLVRFNYRSDREPSIVAMFEQACVLSGRQGENVSQPLAEGEDVQDAIFDFDGTTIDLDPVAPSSTPEPTVTAAPSIRNQASRSRMGNRRRLSRL